ncbi:magnesium chelatase family protein [Natronincola peptidivorans]|uniref:Magnesium chelatase family protein n=1 Tax=Natronincola peptidivorans TaxID=426128 RepID=A0A1H9ZKI1_9FIRM|nr:YifB family Mg chelatase-like AAA ATPase [Natronincola peptidivorans]SES81308.1 magnesium chelatase family protein [Natronincola peptidivorans]
MASIVKSFSISGVDGCLVDVETKTIDGLPMISIVGLGDTAVKEARERVESALNDGNYEFPQMKVVINLAPSDLKKSGSHFDLPIALGLLMETGQLKTKKIEAYGCIGELSLNARLRSCTGVLPMTIAAKEAGITNIIVPKDNVKEASLVKGIRVYGFDTLKEVVEFLEDKKEYMGNQEEMVTVSEVDPYRVDFKEVQGQEAMIEYIVIAAAGGHNLLMVGTPGCGKSMIAKRIPTILPSMTEEEALEVTKIYSVAGLLRGRGHLIKDRPFRAPHHNASTNSLIGGGNNATPGEISLAHNGVLFLDEIAEFGKKTLEALRQPMEDQIVTISRVKYTNTYPASFMLVAAMNPCPCGYFGNDKCRCSDYEVVKYRQKISGPILDRMDIQKYVQPVKFKELSSSTSGKTSQELRERVEFARSIQKKRYDRIDGINCNAQMGHALIKEYCQLEAEGERLLQLAYERFNYSARTFHKYLKVARTFADMEASTKIRKKDVAAALMARDLEKEGAAMMVL